MNIFNYFKKAGIDTVDVSFYRKIAEWTSWYNSNVRNFLFTECIQDAERILGVEERAWEWQRSCLKTLQTCS